MSEQNVGVFKIEKGIKPARRGRNADLPQDYFKIKATMNVLEKDESFLYPLNGYKASTVMGWVTRADKELGELILEPSLREKNKRNFYKSVIKDADKVETGVRVFRIS